MDFRYFELQDLLSEALIALEAKDQAAAEAAVRKIVRWAEADWLSTPGELAAPAGPPMAIPDDHDDED